ncbi:MAG: response regulator transcription factor, partial [Nocardioidaceae bacterium]
VARLEAPTEQLLAARLCWLLGSQRADLGQRSAAISLLESARRTYAATGAPGMVRRVEATLAGLGSSVVPTAPASLADGLLTAAELRVATAVRSGMSNREIAEALFLSVKTVEFHLGNIFRKLGVHNRTQLATHH